MQRGFAFVAALAASWAGAQTPNAQVAQGEYDFGSVRQGAVVTHAFTVRNTGDGPLQFAGAQLSLPGMKARVTPATVPPGGEGVVSIEWATEHMAGSVYGVAHIQSSDPAHRDIALAIKGSVIAPISIEPLPSVFLSTFANENAERVLTIRNNDERPMTVARVDPGPHVTATLATLEPGKTFSVTVRAAADAAVGRYEESLSLETDKGPLSIPVHLWVKPDLYANPDAVDFGNVSRKQAAKANAAALTQTLVLKRRTGPFRIKAIDSESPFVEVTSTPKGPSDTYTIAMQLRPDALKPGASLDEKVHIRTSDPDFPEIVIPVTGKVTPVADQMRN